MSKRKDPKADKPVNKGGRPTKYTEELITEICERLTQGEPLSAICRDENMPCRNTVGNWTEENPEVFGRIARAREAGEERIAADVLEIVDTPPARVATPHGDAIDSGDVANRKMRAEYRLKLLAKWNPKKWGERLELDATVKSGTEVILPHVAG